MMVRMSRDDGKQFDVPNNDVKHYQETGRFKLSDEKTSSKQQEDARPVVRVVRGRKRTGGE